MVDFTKSISNEHMAVGLKKLLAMNTDLANWCESLASDQQDAKAKDQLTALSEMHRHHIAKLSDSLLYLGAAPDRFKRSNKRNWFPRVKGFISLKNRSRLVDIKHQEAKLRQTYLEILEELKASDEVVNVINDLVNETDRATRSLDL